MFKWVPGGCEDHDDCDCDLHVSFPAIPQIESIIESRYTTHKRTVREMYAAVKAYVVANYNMRPDGSIVRGEVDWSLYIKVLRDFNTPESSIPVSPPFVVSNQAKETSIVPSRKFEVIAKKVERNYWAQLGIYPEKKESDKDHIMSLRNMILKRLSWTDAVFGDHHGLKRIYYTTSYFPLEKQMRLYAEFNNNTMRRGPSEATMWDYTAEAITWLNFHMGVRKNYGTVKFEYNPHKLIRKVKINTSAGIAPGGTVEGDLNGEKVRVVSSGKKLYLLVSAMRKLHDTMTGIMKGDNTVLNAIFAIIKVKHELKIKLWGTIKELRALMMKMREFFIPDLPHTYMSILCNEQRMLLERNNVINIGMKWWYGGARRLFMYLNGDMPNMIYVDGDIAGLDKHIQDWMLLLYCHNVYPYFNWESMSQREQDFLEKLLVFWATNVAYKLVCHVGSFWRYMCGVMYSGGKETSHGGSWIMAFIFYCYCVHIKERYPTRAGIINQFLSLMVIAIVVYGDDHIWCAPSVMRDVMNHKTWKAFLKEYCNMDLRDEAIYESLLSIPDGTGRLRVKGPKFLKRYFIRNHIREDLCPILPFKEIDEGVVRMMAHEGEYGAMDGVTAGEVVIRTMGYAWDFMGTNLHAHNVVTDYYNSIVRLDPRPPLEILRSIDISQVSKTSLKRLIRKIGLTPEDMFSHYPSLSDLLDRHIEDMTLCDHTVKIENLDTWSMIFDDDDVDE